MTRPVAIRRALLFAILAAAPTLSLAQAPAAQAPAAQTPVEAPDPAQPPAPEPAEPVIVVDDGSSVRWARPVLRIGGDYTLAAGEEIREAFVLSGNAVIEGRVHRDVVVAFGTARIADTAIIEGSLVVVGGTVSIAEGARVDRDFVVVGAAVDTPTTFNPGGQHIVVGQEVLGGRLDALVPWVTQGLLWGRLIVPGLPWVWSVVGLFFLVYLALTLVFDRPVRACATTLSRKPLTALLVGLLVLLLTGPVLLLMTVSIIGVAIVPFLICALLLAWIIGKVGVARWIGMMVLPEAEDPSPGLSRLQATRSFVIGFAVLCVAYMVPGLGILAWAAVGVAGLGSAVLAFLAGYRKENPAPPPRVIVPPVHPPVMPAAPGAPQPAASRAVEAGAYQAAAFDTSAHDRPFQETPMSEPTPAMNTPMAHASPYVHAVPNDLLTMPHAAFRDRLAAFVLDLIVVVVTVQLLDFGGDGPRVAFLVLLAYHMAFWASKATTVGGIICQLRIVRVTGEPLRFVDALVRALSAIFSLVPLGLGALWILKDPERQAWHDKIAGTYVVKVPRHYPL